MNKKTVALTHEQFTEIIQTMQNGFLNHEPNRRIATALVVEANLGIRISDIARKLTLSNIIRDGGRYRLDIIEQKTKKKRTFTVPVELYIYLQSYCLENKIAPDEVIFPISERAIQKHLALVCDYLGPDYGNISTHSFRKYFATSIYNNNGKDIALVQRLLQHSSPATTQRYIGIEPERIEKALETSGKKHLIRDRKGAADRRLPFKNVWLRNNRSFLQDGAVISFCSVFIAHFIAHTISCFERC